MSPHLFLSVVAVGSAAVGLWLSVRLRLAPKRGFAAAACLAVAWLVPSLASPLLVAATARLPLGPAILVSVFPVLTVTFALTAAGLRYLAELAGHALR